MVGDLPNVQEAATLVYFETLILGIDYMGTGKDILLATFKWGFEDERRLNYGKITIQGQSPSDWAYQIIRHDYPTYRFFGEE